VDAGVQRTETVVETADLTKRFGHQVVVDGVDLAVPGGAIYGFLGPNGSGKTTSIRMLLGLIAPGRGEVRLLGQLMPDAAAGVLPRVGSLVDGPAFHPYLSGRVNLARLDAADTHSDPATARTRVDAALDRVGLAHAAEKKYRAYSLGMRQRLALAAALLAPRQLLILDEPTNGLDPQGTREVRHLVAELAADGATVLISSHLLSEVEQLCTHAGVMQAGRLLAQGPIGALRARARPVVRVEARQPEQAMKTLAEAGIADVERQPGQTGQPDIVRVTGQLGGADPADIVARLVADGVEVYGFTVDRPSLEDVFVELTGEGFDVSG
jgi:ABC-2 type transport system ATP-binding protein